MHGKIMFVLLFFSSQSCAFFSYKKVTLFNVLWVIGWKQFWHIWPRWPWPLTQWPTSIGLLCCPGRMCGPNLMKVGQGLFELLIGNEKVTDRSTNQHAQSNTPSLLQKSQQYIKEIQRLLTISCTYFPDKVK